VAREDLELHDLEKSAFEEVFEEMKEQRRN